MLKAVLCLDPTPCNVFVYLKSIWTEVLYAFSSVFSSLLRLCKRLTSRLVSCPAGGRLVTCEALRLLTLRPKSSRLEGCRWCLRALSMPFSDEASVVLRWRKNPPPDRTRQHLMVMGSSARHGFHRPSQTPYTCAGCIGPGGRLEEDHPSGPNSVRARIQI